MVAHAGHHVGQLGRQRGIDGEPVTDVEPLHRRGGFPGKC
jgi:hypothetical protein